RRKDGKRVAGARASVPPVIGPLAQLRRAPRIAPAAAARRSNRSERPAMTDTVTIYDQVPYAYYSFPDSHPRRLQAVARLLGLETAALEQWRVLELGCAVGGNIVPMAYSLPNAQFIGIDLVTSQIETAKQF